MVDVYSFDCKSLKKTIGAESEEWSDTLSTECRLNRLVFIHWLRNLQMFMSGFEIFLVGLNRLISVQWRTSVLGGGTPPSVFNS